MTIQDWRLEIDSIDRELLSLLNQRASLAVKVGQFKRRAGVELFDPAREREIIERACNTNPGPLDEQAIEELFGCIIRESRRIEACAMERAGKET